MDSTKSVEIRQFLAYLTAIFLYQKKKNLMFELPLGIAFDFKQNDSKFKLSRQASRVLKNTLNIHYYSNAIKINNPKYTEAELSKWVEMANHYDLKEMEMSVNSKINEHFGSNNPLDQSAVVYLMHKAFHTSIPADARNIITHLTESIFFVLAHKKELSLPYNVKLSLTKEKNLYFLNILESV